MTFRVEEYSVHLWALDIITVVFENSYNIYMRYTRRSRSWDQIPEAFLFVRKMSVDFHTFLHFCKPYCSFSNLPAYLVSGCTRP